MAINPGNLYPGKTKAADADYPYGSARNVTTPGDGTGTPWEAALVNDIFGFQQALLDEAGEVPTGSPEKVGASQYLTSLRKIFTTAGVTEKDVSGGADVTLTADEAGRVVLVFTGEITGDLAVIVPDTPRVWLAVNATTGGFEVTVRTSAGGGAAIPRGFNVGIRSDGTNVQKYLSSAGEKETQQLLAERRITSQATGGGALTPVTFAFDDGTIVCMYRAGSTIHGVEEGAYPAIIRSFDGGLTWTDPSPVVQDATYDLRNYGGGIAPNGDLILFYCRRATAGTDEAGYIISSDQGETWGSPQVLSGIASVPTVHAVHAVFGSTIVQPMLGDTPGRGIWLARSTDNGQNWSIEEVFTEADATAVFTGAALNETCIVAISDTDGLLITRPEGGEAIGRINPLAAYTTDGGATWSALVETNSPMGSQPPTLHFDGDFIWHLWPNRKASNENVRRTYAPVIRGESTAGNHTYSRQKGGYIEDGYTCHVWVSIVVDSWDPSATGELQVTLPVPFDDEFPDFGPCAGAAFRRMAGIPSPAGSDQIVLGTFEGRDHLTFYGTNAGDISIKAEDVTSPPVIEFSISYPIRANRGILEYDSSYYAALLHKDNLTDPTKFRAPFALPISIPKHGDNAGGTNGDSGYANVIDIKGAPHMMYYKGAFNADGSDLYLAPLPSADYKRP